MSRDGNELVPACLKHLQDENKILSQFEEVLRKKRDAHIQRNADSLFELGEQLRIFQLKTAAVTKARIAMQAKIGEWLGLAPEELTITRIIEQHRAAAPDSDSETLRDALADLQHEVRTKAERVRRLLHENKMVAAQHNLIICQSLAILTGQMERLRYGASGQIQTQTNVSRFEAEL